MLPSALVFTLCRRLPSSPPFQKLEFLQTDSSGSEAALSRRMLSPEELSQQLEKLLLEDMASDEQIFDWVEVRPAGIQRPGTNMQTIRMLYSQLEERRFLSTCSLHYQETTIGLRLTGGILSALASLKKV